MKAVYLVAAVTLMAVFGCSGNGASADNGGDRLDWADKTLWYGGAARIGAADSALPDVVYFLPTCVADWTDSTGTLRHNADPKNSQHIEAWRLSAELADTIFATRANLYIPYYRQATFGGLVGEAAKDAMPLAVGDALGALDYYLKHYNHKRPFILAGYSQGGQMVKEALKHISDDDYGRLVAAYVVGYGVTASDTMTQPGHRTSHIKLAQDSTAHGVTVNFISVTTPTATCPLLSDGNIGCINPMTWTTTAAPATLLPAGATPKADDPRFPYATAARPKTEGEAVTVAVDTLNHVLTVGGIDAGRYYFEPLGGFFPVGNLHLQELFFYGDLLRRNVLLRSCMR